jgi:hypothetical protein
VRSPGSALPATADEASPPQQLLRSGWLRIHMAMRMDRAAAHPGRKMVGKSLPGEICLPSSGGRHVHGPGFVAYESSPKCGSCLGNRRIQRAKLMLMSRNNAAACAAHPLAVSKRVGACSEAVHIGTSRVRTVRKRRCRSRWTRDIKVLHAHPSSNGAWPQVCSD